MQIREALDEFMAEHRGRGSRPKTMQWYESTITRLLRAHLDAEVSALTPLLVNRVLDISGVSPSSLANYDRALRGFCNWLHGVGELERNPFAKRKRPRERFEPKQVLSEDEIAEMLRVARRSERARFRKAAILMLFLETGIRASELARLQLCDFDPLMGLVRIDGKTGAGTVPVGKGTVKVMRSYISQERKGRDPHLFLYAGKPLNQNSLSHLIARIAKEAGITRPVSCHLLRHTAATLFLRNGGSPFALQRLLRHQSPAMVSRYVHFMVEDLRDDQERFSALSRVRR